MNVRQRPNLAELPPPPSTRQGWPWTEEGPRLPDTMPDGSPWPRISVVTPSYNQGQFIEETIRSVLLQGYPDLEYIIMDGGSTDNSVDIIRKYERWISHWVSGPDGGQAAAINAGWRLATGQALTWLNSDDTLANGALSTAADLLFHDQATDLIYGDVHLIDAESRVLYTTRGRPFNPEAILLKGHNPIPQQGFLMHRRLLDEVGPLDEGMQFCMDFDYWTRLALHERRVLHIDKVLAGFRQHPSTKTRTYHKARIADRTRIQDKVFKSPRLPAAWRNLRRKASEFADLNAAYIAYKADDVVLTRALAWRYVSSAKQRTRMMGLYLLGVSLCGAWGIAVGKRLRAWLVRLDGAAG